MIGSIAIVSKFVYLCTIGLAFWSFWVAFQNRNSAAPMPTIFLMLCVLVPLYAVFAILYVFDIAYHAAFGYIGWTLINTLFISTILVLIKGYVSK